MITEDYIKNRFNNDIKIIPSVYVCDTATIRISFFKRLFSWPWRPWVKTKCINEPAVYFFKDSNTALVSYETYSKIMKEKEKNESI